MNKSPAYIVAGTHSGVGKTTISIALLRYYTMHGYKVQAFKIGPDFIDPMYHELASKHPSYTLDTVLTSQEHIQQLFYKHHMYADISIVEGVMGLFDGASSTTSAGSTEEIANILHLPLLLVVNAKGMSRSIAALVHGYTTFTNSLRYAGIICTHVSSAKHEQYLQQALEHYCPTIPVLGYIPPKAFAPLPSRHLGLTIPTEAYDSLITTYAKTLAQYCSLSTLLPQQKPQELPKIVVKTQLPRAIPPYNPVKKQHKNTIDTTCQNSSTTQRYPQYTIGISKDEAFCFLYQENLDILASYNIHCVFFSPLHDATVPNVDALFLTGGYPELYAEQLNRNTAMRTAILCASMNMMPIYAECGGFMYLMESITDATNTRHTMAGCFPIHARMQEGRKALGYRYIAYAGKEDTIIATGHEFHYSARTDTPTHEHAVWKIYDKNMEYLGYEGYHIRNTYGSYVHLLFAENTVFLEDFLSLCNTVRHTKE